MNYWRTWLVKTKDSIDFMAVLGLILCITLLLVGSFYYYYPIDFQNNFIQSLVNFLKLIEYRYYLIVLMVVFLLYFVKSYLNRVQSMPIPMIFGVLLVAIFMVSLGIITYHAREILTTNNHMALIRAVVQPSADSWRNIHIEEILRRVVLCELPYYLSLASYYLMIVLAVVMPSKYPSPPIMFWRYVQFFLSFLFVAISVIIAYYAFNSVFRNNPFSMARSLQELMNY